MANIFWGLGSILLGTFITTGIFTLPFAPKQLGYWGCVLGGPALLLFGVLQVWGGWQELRARIDKFRRAHAIGPETENRTVDELVRLVGADGGFANAGQIRLIGKQLHRRGGIELMRAHYDAVRQRVYFSQDIWDEIGLWQK